MTTLRALCITAAVASTACGSHTSPSVTGAVRADSAATRQLQSDLFTIFNAPAMQRGVWGVDVRSAETGQILFQHNAERLMMPASNMKILTLSAAAQALGWDFRFTTTLETTAVVENGMLLGDLIARGTGDPTISSRGERARAVFDEWAGALRDTGISEIQGRIIGDDQAFDDEGLGPGWAWDYLDADYAAPIGALQYNENIADVTITPGPAAGDAVAIRVEAGSGLTVVNRARTVDATTEVQTPIDIHRRVDRPEIEVTGMVPLGAAIVRRQVAVVNPTLFFAQAVKDALTSRGVVVHGQAVDGDDVAADRMRETGTPRVLHTTSSPTLREMATVLMKISQNQYGETLLKALGASRGGLGTTRSGRNAAIETFNSWSIPTDAYVMADGSGLSRYNYVTPAAITSILRQMYSDARHRDSFLATLPIAGKDGTIASRMRKTRAAENATAKTGSIANVRSLSGFVRTHDGEVLVFSIIANDFVIPAANVNWAADLAVETLANFTRR